MATQGSGSEVGEIPLELQSKLLRILQEGQFERVGDERTRTARVRLIAATNRGLLVEAKAGRFRLDLYYRLSVFPIEVAPLRQRLEDFAELAENFIKHAARHLGVPGPRPPPLHDEVLQNSVSAARSNSVRGICAKPHHCVRNVD